MKNGKHYKGLLILAALFIAAPVLVWQAALRGTYRTVSETSKLKKVLAGYENMAGDAPRQVLVTESEDLLTDGLILERIGPCAESNNLKVIEYQPYTNENSGSITVLSAEITVTGSFVSIVRVINELENQVSECRIKSVEFHKTLERRDRTQSLKAVIVVQQLIST